MSIIPEPDSSAVNAAWRFTQNADQFGDTPESILAPHRQQTIERMRTQPVVLCVQGDTLISFSTQSKSRTATGKKPTSAETSGVRMHAAIALNENGLPLGILRCAYGKKTPKTRNWLYGLRNIDKAASDLADETQVFSVMDRDADAFEILSSQQTLKRTHVLVRTRQDRELGRDGETLFKTMSSAAPAGVIRMEADALRHWRKSSRTTHKGAVPQNMQMQVRFRNVTLPPTKNHTQSPVQVWGIHLRELYPPENTVPLEYYLLTTKEVTSLEEAEQMFGYYNLRRHLDGTFQILKTGCKVEKLQMQDVQYLHPELTLYMVTAWIIMLMKFLRHMAEELPAKMLFTESELQMIRVYANSYNLPESNHLASAILLVAMMGGYMNRNHDPPPGPAILWRGYANLRTRAAAYEEITTFYDLVERPSP